MLSYASLITLFTLASAAPLGLTRVEMVAQKMAAAAALLKAKSMSSGPGKINLGSAGQFAILSQSGISAIPSTSITGSIGVSPAAASYITGFSLIYAPGSPSAKSTSVMGSVYAADFGTPTPSYLSTAIGDSHLAYASAQALKNPDFINLGAGGVGGLILVPGLYKWSTDVSAASDFTLSGSANATWVFQIAGTFSLPSGVKMILAGGALAENVFFAVASTVTLGTTSHAEGILSSSTAVHLLTGATMNGRIFAQTAVTMQQATVVQPSSTVVLAIKSPVRGSL
ncbi:hypothetical protein RQP46_008851 [Phenoliferia psychrophenolica]